MTVKRSPVDPVSGGHLGRGTELVAQINGGGLTDLQPDCITIVLELLPDLLHAPIEFAWDQENGETGRSCITPSI